MKQRGILSSVSFLADLKKAVDSPSESTDQSDKFVQLGTARPREERAEEDSAGAENVLLPLD